MDELRAAELREALVERMIADGRVTGEVTAAAFRAVPRHRFAPAGTPLEDVYNAADAVITKRDERGAAVSSISAPFIQARMIEQAELAPGMSVLEIGSGGYNAALLAEVVGEKGRVVSVDIDPEVVDRACAALEATGYGDSVTVVCADAAGGVPGDEVFDRIIVTVGAPDVPPSWLAQLAADGVIVLPLIAKGITRSVALHRRGDHLVSTSAEVCGFVPMQGEGARPEQVVTLPDERGLHVQLRFAGEGPDDPRLLDGVLGTRRSEAWSGVTILNGVSFADLHLWFAGFLPGFCRMAAAEGTTLAAERKGWFPFAAVPPDLGDSFAYLAIRSAPEGVEFGARAYGPHGDEAAAAMVEQIQAWDEVARHVPSPDFAFWPVGIEPNPVQDLVSAAFPTPHGLITISWPAAD
ncbi:hypothetical protein HerbRD11066_27970 [Herbidospora sp. RD11066]